MATAIITGGSSGIGLKFAQRLAARGLDLILIARDKERLHQVSQELSDEYGVSVDAIVANLANEHAVEKLSKLIAKTDDLAYMINNAGFATHVSADDNSAAAHELQRDAIRVMALNTLIFSSAAASAMVKRGQGRIINISSTASWTFQGNYSAIKSYVLTYTEGLAISLAGTGVTATAVCPAWMHTNFHAAAGLGEPSIPEWLYVQPDQVVDQALMAADKGKPRVVPTIRWRIIIWFLAHGPVALRRYITRRYISSGNYRHDKDQASNHNK